MRVVAPLIYGYEANAEPLPCISCTCGDVTPGFSCAITDTVFCTIVLILRRVRCFLSFLERSNTLMSIASWRIVSAGSDAGMFARRVGCSSVSATASLL